MANATNLRKMFLQPQPFFCFQLHFTYYSFCFKSSPLLTDGLFGSYHATVKAIVTSTNVFWGCPLLLPIFFIFSFHEISPICHHLDRQIPTDEVTHKAKTCACVWMMLSWSWSILCLPGRSRSCGVVSSIVLGVIHIIFQQVFVCSYP